MSEIWHFLAGLGLFLYGISRIENALHELGGRKFVQVLRSHTNNYLESILSGTALTALLQSSSLVSLMVLAFVGSQYIPMTNALGIIMGANLGTTFTGWIVAFFGFKLDIEFYSLPVIAVGALGYIFIQREHRLRHISMFALGFGLLLFGLGFMKSGMEDFVSAVDITAYAGYSIIYFFVLGIIVTAIIQSSSAMMAITLSALSLETISISQAAATVIGADLGTTVTVILGSLSGVRAKKQVACFHVLFNLIVDVLSLLFLPILLFFILEVIKVGDPLFALVLFHNIFNAIGIVLFVPFLPMISKYIEKMFKENDGDSALYINTTDQSLPSIPMDSIKNEIEHMIVQAVKYNMQILQIKDNDQQSILGKYEEYVTISMPKKERYEFIKRLESEIIIFSTKLKQNKLSNEEISNLALYIAAVRNLVHSVRSMKSIRYDLLEIVRVNNEDSYKKKDELIKKTKSLYREIISLLSSENKDYEFEELAQLENINEYMHDKLVEFIYDQYSKDVSTPLNVIREIYSSNKALINAVKEYKLDIEILATFDKLPMMVR